MLTDFASSIDGISDPDEAEFQPDDWPVAVCSD